MKRLVLKTVSSASVKVGITVEAARRMYVSIGLVDEVLRDRAARTICYWRMLGRRKADLLSLDLDRKSGEVWGIDLVSYGGEIVDHDDRSIAEETPSGFPAFDMASWVPTGGCAPAERPTELVDVYEDFGVSVGSQTVRLALLPTKSERFVISGDKIIMGFNAQSELSEIVICGLTAHERDELRGARARQ